MPRLTSAFWVSAHLRLCALEGIDAVLRRRGAAEAGAVFASIDRLSGEADLYGPAPQGMTPDADGGRLFAPVLVSVTPAAIEDRMAREVRFDPDLWWIAIDDREGRFLFGLAPDAPLLRP